MTTLLVGVAWVGLEYWLGKTEKVKAGSTLELVLNAAGFILKALTK